MATHSTILAWRIPMDREARQATVHGVTKSQTERSDQAQHSTRILVSIFSQFQIKAAISVPLKCKCNDYQLHK